MAKAFLAGAKAQTQLRDWNALRDAIRSRADHEEIERLWDRCERWVVTIPGFGTSESWPAAEAENTTLPAIDETTGALIRQQKDPS